MEDITPPPDLLYSSYEEAYDALKTHVRGLRYQPTSTLQRPACSPTTLKMNGNIFPTLQAYVRATIEPYPLEPTARRIIDVLSGRVRNGRVPAKTAPLPGYLLRDYSE
ncbi:hypothetical protein EJ04DRAFT_520181 [Polyplosphaeria fusca]|uniref:Uncharacterized protein n=1 Tax=Polyplosphaeria fusca TaxID=682080 RepID=A0A9P4R7Z6_9PLEO|nr:hypothetical protein EJ04DRAFT_520181 [Polyplosphaeria fusca]